MNSNGKNKVLFLVQLPPPVHGASLMNQFIVSSRLIKDAYSGHSINITIAKDIDDIGKGGLKKVRKAVSVFFQVLWRLISVRPNLCYITLSPFGFGFYKDAILILLIKLFRIRYCIHLQGKGIYNSMVSARSSLLYKVVFHNSYVITLAKVLNKDLEKLKHIKRIQVVNNAIAEIDFPSKEHKGINVVYISNMVEEKGPMDLLLAAKMFLSESDKEVYFTFAGKWINSTFRDKFNKYLEDNNLQHTCKYVGPVYNDEKLELFSNSDIMVLPTYYPNECFPLAILEGMSFGMPVISTEEGAISEIIVDGKNGLLVPAKSPKKIAEAIKVLVDNPMMLKRLGNQAKLDFRQKYTHAIFEQKFVQAINNCLM